MLVVRELLKIVVVILVEAAVDEARKRLPKPDHPEEPTRKGENHE